MHPVTKVSDRLTQTVIELGMDESMGDTCMSIHTVIITDEVLVGHKVITEFK